MGGRLSRSSTSGGRCWAVFFVPWNHTRNLIIACADKVMLAKLSRRQYSKDEASIATAGALPRFSVPPGSSPHYYAKVGCTVKPPTVSDRPQHCPLRSCQSARRWERIEQTPMGGRGESHPPVCQLPCRHSTGSFYTSSWRTSRWPVTVMSAVIFDC